MAPYSYVDKVCDDMFDLFIMNNWLDWSNLLQLTKMYLRNADELSPLWLSQYQCQSVQVVNLIINQGFSHVVSPPFFHF